MHTNASFLHELLHTPETSSTVFWLGAAHSPQIAWALNPPQDDDPQALELLHLTIMPFGAATILTAQWIWQPARPKHSQRFYARQIALGFALGCGSVAIAYSSAYYLGWLQFEAWAWQRHPLKHLVRYQALTFIGMGAVAFNEELVYRGYGYDSLEPIYGPWISTLFTTTIFILWHELDQPFVDTCHYGLSGLAYHQLKQLGTLALPIGFHWGWNWALLGFSSRNPQRSSLKPCSVPPQYQRWMGTRTADRPSWFTAFVKALVLLVAWWNVRRKTTLLEGE